jgi:hypothetical protein
MRCWTTPRAKHEAGSFKEILTTSEWMNVLVLEEHIDGVWIHPIMLSTSFRARVRFYGVLRAQVEGREVSWHSDGSHRRRMMVMSSSNSNRVIGCSTQTGFGSIRSCAI